MQSILRLELAEAQVLIDGASRRARQIGVPMCIAVADESGRLIAFVREDGAKVTSISIALDKAFTAAGARNQTAYYSRISIPGAPAWGIGGSNGGHFTPIAGGVHVLWDTTVVGGIGISGGTSEQDHDVAVSAVAFLSAQNPGFRTEEKHVGQLT